MRATKKSAESYLASLGGNGGRLLDDANIRQRELLAQKPAEQPFQGHPGAN